MGDTQTSEWIEWKGGEMPVPKDTLVDVRDLDGTEWPGFPADFHPWNVDDCIRLDDLVAAYRVVKP